MRRLLLALVLFWPLAAGAITKPAYVAGQMVNKSLPINNGLVLAWLLNENSGTVANDSSGYGNTGTLQGTPTPTWNTGTYGPAVLFPASNANSVIYSPITMTPPFTLFMSVNPSQVAAYAYVAMAVNTGNYSLAQNMSTDWELVSVVQNIIAPAIGTQVFLTYIANSATSFTIYVGNVPQTAVAGAVTWSSGFYFGGRQSGTNGFSGTGDFMFAWNRALSAGEIATLNANPFAPYAAGCNCLRRIRQAPRWVTQQQCCDDSARLDPPRARDVLASLAMGW